jgi:hypothetical protein
VDLGIDPSPTTSAPNGGCSHSSSTTGTTSMWAMSTSGSAAPPAGPAEQQGVAVDDLTLESGVRCRIQARQRVDEARERIRIHEALIGVRDGRNLQQLTESGDRRLGVGTHGSSLRARG